MLDMTDQQLIEQYRRGQRRALEFLVSRYLQAVFRLACAYAKNNDEAEDITQETFIKAWKNLHKFRSDGSFKAWLLVMAKHTAIDYVRRQKTVPFSAFTNHDGENCLAETVLDQRPAAGEVFDQTVLGQELDRAKNSLLAKEREVLDRYHLSGLTFKAIGRLSGESLHTVKSRYRRALLKMRQLLHNHS